MSLGPRAGGAVGVAFGAACTAFTWYTAHNEGRFSIALCLIGPAVFMISLAFLLVPVEKLVNPKEIDGKLDYDLRNPNYTLLGWCFLLMGFAASGLFFAYLSGWL